MVKVRSIFNYDRNFASIDSGVSFSNSPSRTQQHMKNETDINFLVNRFIKTGYPPVPPMPSGAEFNEVFDFQTAMNVVVRARESFNALPSRVRARFSNDPAQLMAFVSDESNRSEAIKLGLIEEPELPLVDEPSVNDIQEDKNPVED